MDVMSPTQSPKGYFPTIKSFGATRLNKRVVGVALIVFAGAALVLLLTISGRANQAATEKEAAANKAKADVASAPDLQKSTHGSGNSTFASSGKAVFTGSSLSLDPELAKERAEFDKEIRRYEHQQQMQRLARRDNALTSAMEARGVSGVPAVSEQADASQNQQVATLQRLPNGQLVLGGGDALGADGTSSDPNLQGRKESFFAKETESSYLPYRKEAARSPFEVKEGSVIPGVMISGINSDLPGQIIAQVSQNVFDSVSGKHLLIPQGTKIVGSYDSYVAVGQDSAMVAWRRLIFPDGMSIELANMPGADQGGYAGFRDQVNNHYFRIFGGAVMMSFLGAGFQLSQPRPHGEYPSNQEIVAAEVSRNISQVGIELARRDMRIQPTIEIRPGYKFNIMVRRDMILEPYQEE